MLDRRSFIVGAALLAFVAILGLILYLELFEETTLITLIGIFTIFAFITCFEFCYLALRLYGWKSSEGRFWFLLIIMLVTVLVGTIVSALVSADSSHKVFSLFLAAAFIIIFFGIIDKMKYAGVKPGKADLFVATVVVLFILALIAIIGRSFEDQIPADFRFIDYALEWFVIIMAFIVTFMTVVMGSLMGDHVSEGWYILAVGAGIYATSYGLQTVLTAVGEMHDAHFITVLDIAALISIAFSAWYQRRKHLELIANM